jgi:hypothetical protein
MGDQNAVGAREHWRLQIFAGFAPVNGLPGRWTGD